MLSSHMPILYVLCCLIQVEVIKKEHPWIPLQGFSSQYTFFFFWEKKKVLQSCHFGKVFPRFTCEAWSPAYRFCTSASSAPPTSWQLGPQGFFIRVAGAEMKGEYKFVAFVCSFLNLIPFLTLKLKTNKR